MVESAQPRHIAIIGGGIIGASTAYYLSRGLPPTTRVSLIEEAPSVAPGSSGKSGGFLAQDWHGADTADLGELSYRLHRELALSDDGANKWGYRTVDTLSLHFDDAKTKSKCPEGLKSWLDAKHVTSSSAMGGGGTTAQVTPLALVEHLVEQAKSSGVVEVLCSTRAQRIQLNDQGRVKALVVQNVDDKQETTLDVDDIVVAAGPWTGTLLKSLLPSKATASLPRFVRAAMQITGSRAHSIVVQSPKPTTSHCLFTDMHYSPGGAKQSRGQSAGAPEIYCRSDGTVYACGGSDDVPLPPSAMQVDYDRAQTKRLIEQCASLSPTHLSQNAGAQITRQQACYLPTAPSSPIITGDAKSGIYVAAGHSCWGITLGLGTGKVMREMLMGEKLSADIRRLN